MNEPQPQPSLQPSVILDSGTASGSRRAGMHPIALTMSLAVGLGLLCSVVILAIAPGLQDGIIFLRLRCFPQAARVEAPSKLRTERTMLKSAIADLAAKTSLRAGNEPYLIVNTIDNAFDLTNGTSNIRSGKCSSGSYILLKSRDKRTWIFETPRGMFSVLSKVESPVWRMPDWAFVENGKPIPAANAEERYEPGVLGDYALLLGHGYMIHGTLYQRFLGLPVTHGCVRLGDEDLKAVYAGLHVGSKVYMY